MQVDEAKTKEEHESSAWIEVCSITLSFTLRFQLRVENGGVIEGSLCMKRP